MKQKYALVTGTDHGVGYALTKQLLERGYHVVAVRLNEKETQLECLAEKYKEKLIIVQADIGSDESVAELKEQTLKRIPRLDLLINNAGILGDMQKELGDELDFDEMLRVINVNALGTLRVTNAMSELLQKSEDKTVVNISSEAGSIADCERTGWFGYCMAKAANNMQSALVHNNLCKQGGRVFAIHPGHVATYMRGHLDTSASLTPEESAVGILEVVLESEFPVKARPSFLDYKGVELPW